MNNKGVRINRYLALCGVASRRKAEDLIRKGRVIVDGEIVDDPAFCVMDGMSVFLDGSRISPEKKIHLVINKPRGYVCAVEDRFDPVVLELLPDNLRKYRLFPVGRLDRESEGLLILTNDGDFTQKLAHPRYGVEKEYEVLLDRAISMADVSSWSNGVRLDERMVVPHSIMVMKREPQGRWLQIVLGEGFKREIRLMARHFSHDVKVLFRRKIGKMELRSLASGEFKVMSVDLLWEKIYSGGIV